MKKVALLLVLFMAFMTVGIDAGRAFGLNASLPSAQIEYFFINGNSSVSLGAGGVGSAYYTLSGPSAAGYEYRWSAVGTGTNTVTPSGDGRGCRVEFKSTQSGQVRVSCDVYLNGSFVGAGDIYVDIIY